MTKISHEVVLRSLEKKAQPILSKLNSLSIETADDFNEAGARLKALKSFAKIAETEKKTITDPLNQTMKAVNAHFAPFFNSIKLIEAQVKEEMERYLQTVDKKVEQLQEDFKVGTIKKVTTLHKKTEEVAGGLQSTVQQRFVTAVTITDLKKIPLKYLVPDEELIKRDLLEGKKVPGAKLEERRILAI